MKSEKPLIKINLIERHRERKKVKKPSLPKAPSFMPVVVLLLVGVLIVCVWDYRLLSQKSHLEAKIREKRRVLNLLRAKAKEVSSIEKELKELRAKKSIIQEIIRQAHLPLKVILAIQNSMPEDVWLNSFNLKGKKIYMKGYALNDDSLADFVERLLEQKKLIGSVSVKRYEKTKINGVEAKRFVGEVLLK